jgi:integrase
MAQNQERPKKILTAVSVRSRGDGFHADGTVPGLYLHIESRRNIRCWKLLIQFQKKRREIGLGSAAEGADNFLSLSDARVEAIRLRKEAYEGRDPLLAGRAKRVPSVAIIDAPKATTSFGTYADQYYAGHCQEWKNEKHKAQWKMCLTKLCKPIRELPISDVDTEAVKSVLQPLWEKIPETAQRLRTSVEKVLDAATVDGLRTGENPARWRGHLEHVLSKRRKLTRGHQRALPYQHTPTFMSILRLDNSTSARLLEFQILTAARPGEARAARWSEFDLQRRIRTIPASRMKAGKEHRIPLSERVMVILRGLADLRAENSKDTDLVFVNPVNGRSYSENATMIVLQRLGYARSATAHGFRNSFTDWAHEETTHATEVIQLAKAHKITDKVEAAYRRSDLFEKRRNLMDDWASFCGRADAQPLAAAAAE